MPENITPGSPRRIHGMKDDPLLDLDELIQTVSAPEEKSAGAVVDVAESPAELIATQLEEDPGRPLEPASPIACPHLSLLDQRGVHRAEPDPAHRCWGAEQSQPIFEAHQRQYCLTAGFATCEMFLSYQSRAREEAGTTKGRGWLARLFRRRR